MVRLGIAKVRLLFSLLFPGLLSALLLLTRILRDGRTWWCVCVMQVRAARHEQPRGPHQRLDHLDHPDLRRFDPFPPALRRHVQNVTLVTKERERERQFSDPYIQKPPLFPFNMKRRICSIPYFAIVYKSHMKMVSGFPSSSFFFLSFSFQFNSKPILLLLSIDPSPLLTQHIRCIRQCLTCRSFTSSTAVWRASGVTSRARGRGRIIPGDHHHRKSRGLRKAPHLSSSSTSLCRICKSKVGWKGWMGSFLIGRLI